MLRFIRRWQSACRARFSRTRVEREMDAELRFHLECEAEENRAKGMDTVSAQRQARRRLGGLALTRDACRDAIGLSLFDLIELRALLRSMRRNWLSSGATVVMLAVAIAAATATFGLADAALWRELPYANAKTLVSLVTRHVKGDANVSVPDFLQVRQRASGVHVAAAGGFTPEYALTGLGEPRQVRGRVLTADYFHTLGVPLARGRDFTQQEEKPGAGTVAIITDHLWSQLFGRREIIGEALALNGRSYTIVGVAAPYRDPFGDVDLYVPLQYASTLPRHLRLLTPIARLTDGGDVAAFRAQLPLLTATDDAEAAGYAVDAVPLSIYLGNPLRSSVRLLFGAGIALLLIGLLNFAMLLAARTRQRSAEFSMRMALGATRVQIVRLAAMEAVLLSAAGLACALVAQRFLTPLVQRQFGAQLVNGVSVNVRTLMFGLLVAIVAAGVSVLVSLRTVSRLVTSDRRIAASRLSGARVLVIAQVAMSMVLVVGTATLGDSLRQLRHVQPGFQVAQLYATRLALPAARYASAARRLQFWRALLDGLTTRGMRAAAVTSELPLTGEDNPSAFTARLANGTAVVAKIRSVSPGYFDAMHIPRRLGRLLVETDTATAPRVAVVNERLAALLSPFGTPLGQTLAFDVTDPPLMMRVVGVVGDIHHEHLGIPPKPEAYASFAQSTQSTYSLVINSDRPAGDLSNILKETVRTLDAGQPVKAPIPMDTYVTRNLSTSQFQMQTLGLFAGGGLLIACFGLYALLTFLVSASRREWAIRLALGATSAQLRRHVLRQAGLYGIAGVFVGLVLYALSSRALAAVTYGAPVWNPWFALAAALTMIGVCTGAALAPASRASRIAPREALTE